LVDFPGFRLEPEWLILNKSALTWAIATQKDGHLRYPKVQFFVSPVSRPTARGQHRRRLPETDKS
jgi:hypothetical protein